MMAGLTDRQIVVSLVAGMLAGGRVDVSTGPRYAVSLAESIVDEAIKGSPDEEES